MSDTLRTRLVRVFHDADTNSCATEADWTLLADAVIRELDSHGWLIDPENWDRRGRATDE